MFNVPFCTVHIICDSKLSVILRDSDCDVGTYVYNAPVKFTVKTLVANVEIKKTPFSSEFHYNCYCWNFIILIIVVLSWEQLQLQKWFFS